MLDQQDYIDSIEIPKIPIARRIKKTEPLNPEENTIYRSLVGALNWIVQNTRPDLSFELTYLSSKFDKAEIQDLQQIIKALLKVKEEKSELLFPHLGDPLLWGNNHFFRCFIWEPIKWHTKLWRLFNIHF